MTQAGAIVAGIDGSVNAERAVRWAVRKAQVRGLPLHLLTAVVSAPATWLPAALVKLAEQDAEKRIDAARLVAADEGPDVEVTTEIVRESARSALISASKVAAMVVVGAAGENESGVAKVIGSTAVALAAHSHCPVAVVRRQSRSAQARPRVVVGVDGTPNSEPAIAVAFGEAAAAGAELIALHAWSDFRLTTAFTDLDLSWEAIAEAEEAVLAERLAGHQAEHPDVPVSRVVVRDSPLPHLITQSREASLVVVGSHGRGGFRGMLIGSTSAALVQNAHCPVLVVRSR